MTIYEIAVAGMGTIQSLLLLLVKPDDESFKKEYIQHKVDEYLRKNKIPSNSIALKNFLTWVEDNNFTIETLHRSENLKFLIILDSLKERFIGFYFKKLSDIPRDHSDFDKVYDIDEELGRLALQIMRLRLVIQPEFQLSKNIHPLTKIKYISAKGNWINDDFSKSRRFTKSLGRMDNYKDGINDKKAELYGLNLLQPVIFEYYKEIYTK